MDKGKIVVVDDDKIVTSAFNTLLKVEGFTDSHFFNHPKEALNFLKDNVPDLVISDFLMPDMNGLEFLSEVKKLYPEVSRILLTGYADKENAIRAINEVGLYRYIEKPWNNDDLIITIKNGIERSYLLAQLNEKIVEKPVPVQPEKKSILDLYHRDIFFKINSTVIRNDEMKKVKEVAEYMKANPNTKVTLVGYADKGTGTPAINAKIAAGRAAIVTSTLIKKYGIDPSRITEDSKGDTYQPYPENDLNRVTICVVE